MSYRPLRVTFAPAASSFFLMSSASAFGAASLISFGAASTSSFASFKPRPVISRTTLITPIFLSAGDSVNVTWKSVIQLQQLVQPPLQELHHSYSAQQLLLRPIYLLACLLALTFLKQSIRSVLRRVVQIFAHGITSYN